jgi:ATP-dependent RNA helicase RhlE
MKENIKAEAIHGNKSQNARQNALNNFKTGRTRVLIATDIAARGIDVDNLSHVVNYEMPNVPETYVHRIGRTGRAGAKGIAFSFCDAEEKPFLADIQKLIGKKIPLAENNPFEYTGKIPPPAPKPARNPRPETSAPKNNVSQKQNNSPNTGSQEKKPKKRWFNKNNKKKNGQ